MDFKQWMIKENLYHYIDSLAYKWHQMPVDQLRIIIQRYIDLLSHEHVGEMDNPDHVHLILQLKELIPQWKALLSIKNDVDMLELIVKKDLGKLGHGL